MHRSTQKNPSKVCQARHDEHCAEVHKKKLANIKPSIDNTPPKAQTHLENRRKRDQQNEERLTKIEKDNVMLLDKMMTIMKTPNAYIPPPAPAAQPKSLNRGQRKKELEEINAQNQALLKRLQSSKPYYDHKDWDNFGTTQESYLKNICEYPVVKNAKPSPKKSTTTTSSSSPNNRTLASTSSPKAATKKPTPTKSTTTTTKPKPKAGTLKGAAAGAGVDAKKKKKPVKKPGDNDDDSLQLSDLDDDSDVESLAAVETNLDVNKGDFSKLEGDGGDDLDLGSDLSDYSDFDEEEGGDDVAGGTEGGDKEMTASSVAKSRGRSKKSVSSAQTGTKQDAASEMTQEDKATIESSEKHEEFDRDTEAYKPQDDEEEAEAEGEEGGNE